MGCTNNISTAKNLLIPTILTGLMLFSSQSLSAQVLEPLPGYQNHIYLNLGYDFNIASIKLGYARYLEKYRTSAFIDFGQGSSLIGSGNFSIRSGLRTWQGSAGTFDLNTSLAGIYTRSSNRTATYNGLGLDINVRPGLRTGRTGIGLDLQYTTYFSTHIRHTNYWREFFFEDVKDGWYALRINNRRLGAYMTRLIGKNQRWEINLRGGYQTSGQFDKLLPGIYLITGTNIQLK